MDKLNRGQTDPASAGSDTSPEAVTDLEERLRYAEQRYDALVEDLPYAHFTAGLDGTVESMNRSAEEMTGYRASDRPNFQDLILPEDLPRAITDLALVATAPNAGPREYRFHRKDGTQRNVEINTVALRRDGELVGFQGTARDVTEQRESKRALVESEQRFRELAEFLPAIVYEYDLTGRVTYTNRHALAVTGYTEQDLDEGVAIIDLLAPEDRERAAEVMFRLLAGEGPFRRQYHFVRKDGTRVPVEVHGAVIHRGDEIVGVRGLAHDLTDIWRAEADKHALERQMQRAQKLESLGILAGGVAHDFNNLLQVIQGNVTLALDSAATDSPLTERLLAIQRATRHAADLSGQMLAYSGHAPVLVGPIELNGVVRELLDLITASLPKTVTIDLRLSPEPLWVEADRTQLHQVLVNLVTNASEAMGQDAGTLTIETGALTTDPRELHGTSIENDLETGPYAMLVVTDTGCGMDDDTQNRIFDPFFTTKFTGRGLGLAAAFGIVRSHRGAIQAQSAPGQGTTFRVLIPVTESLLGNLPENLNARPRRTPGGTVLLVDDEREVRESTRLLLESAGYSVLEAADGRNAVTTFDQRHDDVSVVILDLSMPGLDGLATFHELRKRDPHVPPIVLCSGYSRQEVTKRFRGLAVDAFLNKPYELRELLDVLRRIDN